MNFFHDTYQAGHVRQQGIDLARAENATRRVRDETVQLRQTVERMRLATAALWELVRERHDLTDDDLLDKIHEIDLRDGKADGRMKTGPSACPDCGRVNRASREACLYCGVSLPPGSPV